jgi:acylphosphatase
MAAGTERREVFYSGRVQGVGFRATARRVAQGHAVTGFVRNLPDRRVQLVAEGLPAEVDRFLSVVAATLADYIRDTQVSVSQPTGEFTSFEVRH